MRISSFTQSEIDYIVSRANFTETEEKCFMLKTKGKTNIELSMTLNICDSTVSTTMKSVRAKITSVLEEKASDKAKNTKKPKESFETLHPMVQYFAELLTKVLENSPLVPESHTTKEWAELPTNSLSKNPSGLNRCLLCEGIMDIDKSLTENFLAAIEAVFESDPFDVATQQAFDDLLDRE